MSSSATITLDTTAPVVALVSASQIATALEVEVEVDEPQLIAARITVVGHDPIDMVVEGTTLRANLPSGTPAQMGVIDADVVDDVLNSATRQVLVPVGAVVAPSLALVDGAWVAVSDYVYVDGVWQIE